LSTDDADLHRFFIAVFLFCSKREILQQGDHFFNLKSVEDYCKNVKAESFFKKNLGYSSFFVDKTLKG